MNIFGRNSLYLIVMSTFYCTFSIVSVAEEQRANNQLKFSLEAEAGYTDNFFSTANDEQSSSFYSLSPSLYFRSEIKRSLFELNSKIEHVAYSRFDEDDHTNYTIKPEYNFKLAHNKMFYVKGAYKNNYETRGTGISIGQGEGLTQGDEKFNYTVATGYQYGSESSSARLSLEGGYSNSEYTTRRAETKRLDQKNLFFISRFDYLLSGKTYLAFEVKHQDTAFEHNVILDSAKQVALAGIKWATTEISELQFLVGYQHISFKEKTFSDDSTFKWRLDYLWKPTVHSEFHFTSERSFEEANRLSDSYNVVERHQAKSKLKLTDYFQVVGSIGMINQAVHTQGTSLDEDYFSSRIGFEYIRNERLKFSLSYEHNDLDATNALINYQRSEILLGVNFSL